MGVVVVGTDIYATAFGGNVEFRILLAQVRRLAGRDSVSPTDPAVVFSVLGQQEISDVAARSGRRIGANDPSALLMAGLLAAGGVSESPSEGAETSCWWQSVWLLVLRAAWRCSGSCAG
jgi:cell volume regulation protein A